MRITRLSFLPRQERTCCERAADAANAYEEALRATSDPSTTPGLLVSFALVQQRLDLPDKAAAAATAAIQVTPIPFHLPWTLATPCSHMSSARLQMTPSWAKAWYRAGSAHADLQEWVKAHACLTTAAALLDPVTEAADLKVCVYGC